MNAKYNWDELEAEFIRSDLGQREFARVKGIPNHSLVTAQSKKREWLRKREEFRTQASERAVVHMADDEGKRRAREARVRDNAIDAIDEAITKMRADMKRTHKVFKDGKWLDELVVVIRAQDVASLIDRLQVLFGKPSTISEERTLGIQLATHDPDILRSIVEATRSLVPDVGGAASSPLPRSGGAREN